MIARYLPYTAIAFLVITAVVYWHEPAVAATALLGISGWLSYTKERDKPRG